MNQSDVMFTGSSDVKVYSPPNNAQIKYATHTG